MDEENALYFWPASKITSVRNQHTQMMTQTLFWQFKKPAVIKMKENAWANDGKLLPMDPNKFGRKL
ncbi:MAG: hypothetical protein WB792_06660 [Desulfobacterales bacterium]